MRCILHALVRNGTGSVIILAIFGIGQPGGVRWGAEGLIELELILEFQTVRLSGLCIENAKLQSNKLGNLKVFNIVIEGGNIGASATVPVGSFKAKLYAVDGFWVIGRI